MNSLNNLSNISNPKDLKELYRLMNDKNEFNQAMNNLNKNVYGEDEINIQMKKTNFSDFSNNMSSTGFKRTDIVSKYQNEKRNLMKAYIEYNEKFADKMNLELLKKNNLLDDEIDNEKPKQLIINDLENKGGISERKINPNLNNLNNSIDIALDNVSSRSVSIDKKSTRKIGDVDTNSKSINKSTINVNFEKSS